MRNISDTISRLTALRARRGDGTGRQDHGRLSDLAGFGDNPGALRGRTFIPDKLPAGAPLVVVLHGCTQNAAAYDHGSGWSRLAERHGFAVLYPEQRRANNANLCFNWFAPADTRRGSGEALSIRQMVEALVVRHSLGRKRIFVTGLSAGGAMTSVMLATYPDVFAGGAIIAGLPYGCAMSVPEAFDRMRGHGIASELQLQALVRRASNHAGPWPTLSVWHGDADRTVAPSNMEAIIGQWRGLHGLAAGATATEGVGGHRRRVWRDAGGRDAIEAYAIAGMGHGVPLDAASGSEAAGPYMLDVGFSSTLRIARFWGFTGTTAEAGVAAWDMPPAPGHGGRTAHDRPAANGPKGIGKVIDDALRAAGLLR